MSIKATHDAELLSLRKTHVSTEPEDLSEPRKTTTSRERTDRVGKTRVHLCKAQDLNVELLTRTVFVILTMTFYKGSWWELWSNTPEQSGLCCCCCRCWLKEAMSELKWDLLAAILRKFSDFCLIERKIKSL